MSGNQDSSQELTNCGAQRQVLCVDALEWLRSTAPIPGSSVLASLPDISEFPSYSLEQWKSWFEDAARLSLRATSVDGVTIFFQTDIKFSGEWVDKSYLCQRAAQAEGAALLWHKIACRAPTGQATFGRPGYSHILCFSKSLRLEVEHSTADVLPELGEKTWARGMGLHACVMIAKFLSERVQTKVLVHPFCGQGSMLAAANAFGMDAIGIERSPKRAQQARLLKLSSDHQRWLSGSADE
ncbi:MAG: SAM-dependent methyltransferase [Oligoflexia bacterium]|nr:SAM-dependent methyltransferase [Oligoflexia bacterium]